MKHETSHAAANIGSPGHAEQPAPIWDILRTLWIGKYIIAGASLLAMLIGGYYVFAVATPLYSSRSVVMLNNREQQLLDLEGVVGGLSADTVVTNTELVVLRSRSLMSDVVDRLGLTQDPEFNPGLRPMSFFESTRFSISNAAQSVFGGGRNATENGSTLDITDRQVQATINGLLRATEVRNIPQTLVFEVAVTTSDPQKSALIANTIADTYVLNQIEVKFEATESATTWLADRVSDLQSTLEKAENRVKEFRVETSLVSVEVLLQRESQFKDLRDRIDNLEDVIAETNIRLEAMREATTREAQAGTSGDVQLSQLLTRIDQPSVAASFDSRFDQIISRLELVLERDREQLSILRLSRDELERSLAAQNADLIELEQLEREAEASRLLYEYFLRRLQETSAQEGIQQADSRVLSEAAVPSVPSAPRKATAVVMSGFWGALGGVVLVLLLQMTRNTVRQPSELADLIGFDLSGQIPLIPRKDRKDVLGYLREHSTSAAAEAIRNLRTSILLRDIDSPPKVLMTTSSVPGEGKTTLALGLVQSFAASGKKVCFIEGDLRRLLLSEYVTFDTDRPGLISVLKGDVSLDEALVHDQVNGADFLVAERSVSNAADILGSQKLPELFGELTKIYDYVVIDSPPVLVVPDARIVAGHVDALVYVVHWDSTSKTQITSGMEALRSVAHPPISIALNQINVRRMRLYGYGEAYGAYSRYGSKYYHN